MRSEAPNIYSCRTFLWRAVNKTRHYCHIYFLITMIMIFTTSGDVNGSARHISSIATAIAVNLHLTTSHLCSGVRKFLCYRAQNSFLGINLSNLSGCNCAWRIFSSVFRPSICTNPFVVRSFIVVTALHTESADLSIFKFNQLKIAYKYLYHSRYSFFPFALSCATICSQHNLLPASREAPPAKERL